MFTKSITFSTKLFSITVAAVSALLLSTKNVAANLSNDLQNGLSQETLDELNPLSNSLVQDQLTTPGSIISRLLAFLFPLAGLILFVMLVIAGFEMIATSATKKSIDSGKKRATDAILGFIFLFSVYWIAQIIGYVFQIDIV